ncbi:MAG: hypothetical protein V4615_05235 [Bacteroidota bacterium]
MNKQSLNAAVKRLEEYKGKSEEEVRSAIAADAKGFNEDEQEEVYQAFALAESGNKKGSYVVAEGKSFRDIADFSKEWSEGDDVSHFTPERIQHLLEQGLITE